MSIDNELLDRLIEGRSTNDLFGEEGPPLGSPLTHVHGGCHGNLNMNALISPKSLRLQMRPKQRWCRFPNAKDRSTGEARYPHKRQACCAVRAFALPCALPAQRSCP
jgi:hypothetical protein